MALQGGTVMCMGCGQKIDAEAVFCPKCGGRHVPKSELARVGESLGGRYRLVRPFGDRDGGVTYFAEDASERRKVVVKIFDQPDTLDAEQLRAEASALRSTSSEHLVEVLDFGRRSNGQFFVVMEQPDGEILADRLDKGDTLDIVTATDVLAQLAAMLAATSTAQPLRRDLRPPNVFLTIRSDRDPFVKLLDFRLAKAVERAAGLQPRLDDPRYLAPEAQRGDGGPRVEVYALGVLGYEMLTGKPPLVPPTPLYSVRNDLPSWLDELITSMLSKRAEDRPSGPAAVSQALRDGLLQQTVRTQPPKGGASISDSGVIDSSSVSETSGIMNSSANRAPDPLIEALRSGKGGAYKPDPAKAAEARRAGPKPLGNDKAAAEQTLSTKKHTRVMLIIAAWTVVVALGAGLLVLRGRRSGGDVRPVVVEKPDAGRRMDAAPKAMPPDAAVVVAPPPDAASAVVAVPSGLDSSKVNKADLPELTFTGDGMTEGGSEIELTIYKKDCDKDGGCSIQALALFEGKVVGFGIDIKANMEPTVFYENGVELRSLGRISDGFLAALSNLLAIKIPAKNMKPRIAFRTNARYGLPKKITKKAVIFRVSHDNPAKFGEYFNLELTVNIPDKYVRIAESNPSYRENFIKTLAQ